MAVRQVGHLPEITTRVSHQMKWWDTLTIHTQGQTRGFAYSEDARRKRRKGYR